ncbi:MAG TPA: TetR/AcrR family transcriptional regulator [Pusillimonas sp.]|uniref:TetR/AcrR family transcriptional regulator n=1 Tax=Pusillimonas sp. TaxID=3040095 RepID=UPI002B4AB53E|nr:TetR/AcrR family transcriptional regulator [Pusillimonas sp.]HLU19192.1 TetR/AcrR family transcriptional regulator [Pusillimonas sp.]
MVQVKKPEVAQAITKAAYELFKTHGYSGTRMPQIAKAAKVSAANIYVYFDSKLDILISVYQNWFSEQLAEIKQHVIGCKNHSDALYRLFIAIWKTLPAADGGFCGTLIEALSDRSNQDKYSKLLRAPTDKAIDQMLAHCLPSAPVEARQSISTMLIMAFDGYAVNFHLKNGQKADADEIKLLCDMILATYPPQG